MTDSPSGGQRPARRRAFDKETATTWFMATVIGFGGGAAWRIGQELVPETPGVVSSAVVSNTDQEPLSVYLLPAESSGATALGETEASGERATIVVVRGQSRAPVATTRAS